jgi:hypothetical protein
MRATQLDWENRPQCKATYPLAPLLAADRQVLHVREDPWEGMGGHERLSESNQLVVQL